MPRGGLYTNSDLSSLKLPGLDNFLLTVVQWTIRGREDASISGSQPPVSSNLGPTASPHWAWGGPEKVTLTHSCNFGFLGRH